MDIIIQKVRVSVQNVRQLNVNDGQKWVYGNTPNMENMEITDCYLKGSCGWISNGICYDELNVYKDESGTFVIQTGTHGEGCKWKQ